MAFAVVGATRAGVSGAEFPYSYAQLLDSVVCCNGRDDNYIFSMRTGTFNSLGGMTAPTNTPVATIVKSAGVLTGNFRYRYRWVDANNGTTFTNASAETLTTLAAQNVAFTFNEAPPARATNWILERTERDGSVFYPVNRTAALPNGTPIGTTVYNDSTTDEILRQNYGIPNNYGKPKPFAWCFTNLDRVFMGGRAVLETTIGLTNGTNAFTGVAQLNQNDVGRDITVVGESVSYRILTVVGTGGTIATNYAGATGTKNATIANQGNIVIVSESNQAEGYGRSRPSPLSGLSNEFFLGADAETVQGGVGLGAQGVVYAKSNRLFYHAYSISPISINGDARIVELNTRRGIVNSRCIYFIEGYVYGIDYYGAWRMSPGNLPEDISFNITNDFRGMRFKYIYSKSWWIGFDPIRRNLCFYVTLDDATDQYPNYILKYNIDKEQFIEYAPLDNTMSAGVILPDTLGYERLATFNRPSGTIGAYLWFTGIGNSMGSNPANTLNVGTATGGSTTTIVKTGAGFYTTDNGLASVPVRRYSGNLVEDNIIISNTTDTLTCPAFSVATQAGDRFLIGPIKARYRTGRISLDKINKNKVPSKIQAMQFWLWVRYQGSCTPINVSAYYDGNYQKATPWSKTVNEAGVSITANDTKAIVDPTVQFHMFSIPLGDWEKDIQIEVWSDEPGQPWSILDMKLAIFDGNDKVAQY